MKKIVSIILSLTIGLMSSGIVFAANSGFDGNNTSRTIGYYSENGDCDFPENGTKARHVSKSPFYGSGSDYTKKQTTYKRSLKFDNAIRTYTTSALALLMALVTDGLSYKTIVELIISYYIGIGSNSKNLYYTKIRYGHKNMPGVYHKYVTTWYQDKARTKKVGKKAVYYDANM